MFLSLQSLQKLKALGRSGTLHSEDPWPVRLGSAQRQQETPTYDPVGTPRRLHLETALPATWPLNNKPPTPQKWLSASGSLTVNWQKDASSTICLPQVCRAEGKGVLGVPGKGPRPHLSTSRFARRHGAGAATAGATFPGVRTAGSGIGGSSHGETNPSCPSKGPRRARRTEHRRPRGKAVIGVPAPGVCGSPCAPGPYSGRTPR